ncbi:MAG TPA: hypothetical protein VNZ64_12340 [Candidatus Acidoferrum sp.]|jgi:hypothetical protein|nr:hypothetical protein [Candidatus Acidoferrum sp.]
MNKEFWKQPYDPVGGSSVSPPPLAIHDVPDVPQTDRQKFVAELSRKVKSGKISPALGMDQLSKWPEPKMEDPEIDPRNPFGPERPDQDFSKGRRGVEGANNIGFERHWYPMGWQRVASQMTQHIEATLWGGRHPQWHPPANRDSSPGPGLPVHSGSGDVRIVDRDGIDARVKR